MLFYLASSGIAINVIDRIELMMQNAVVKCQELGSGALQRYHGLTNRSAKEKYGPDFDASELDHFLPADDEDISSSPSEYTRDFFRALRKEKNGRFLAVSELYGFPCGYDPLVMQINDLKDLETLYFGPGIHIEVRLFLKNDFGKGLRCLDARDPQLTINQRLALWSHNPRYKIDQMWLGMLKQAYAPTSGVLISLQNELKMSGERIYPLTDPNEWRLPINPGLTGELT